MSGCFAASGTGARAYYFVTFGISVIVSWILRDYAEAGLKHLPQIKTCFMNQVKSSSPELSEVLQIVRASTVLRTGTHVLLCSVSSSDTDMNVKCGAG